MQTYNCMNTENKDNKLILVKHLNEPSFVEPIPGVLQPLENPTMSEPFSVYPLVYCCSEIGKINEADVSLYLIIGNVCDQVFDGSKDERSHLLYIVSPRHLRV